MRHRQSTHNYTSNQSAHKLKDTASPQLKSSDEASAMSADVASILLIVVGVVFMVAFVCGTMAAP